MGGEIKGSGEQNVDVCSGSDTCVETYEFVLIAPVVLLAGVHSVFSLLNNC